MATVTTTTFTEIAQDAFALLNVFLPGESIPNDDLQFALRTCNRMLNQWTQRSLMIPFVSRERFDLVADQGGEDDPYTIGDGGDFDTERPSNQSSITAANLILTGTDPEVRVPLGIYTTQAYDANQLPGLSNSQPTGLYYNPTYALGLGSIFLWPVPNIATNDLELFLQKSVAQFADTTTTVYLPDSAPEAIVYNLERRLSGPYGRTLSAEDVRIAVESLGVFARANVQMADRRNDASAFTSGRPFIYNILTGN